MPTKPGSPYNTAAYRKAKAVFIANALPVCAWERCPIPGRHVDKRLSGNHPWGPTIDHHHPTSRGGPMWSGWQLMHRRCNMQKGNRVTEPRQGPEWTLDDDRPPRRTKYTW